MKIIYYIENKMYKKGRKTMQNRFKSPVVWLAVLAQICVIVGLFAPDVTDTAKVIGTSIIEILTLFGILNNPTDKEGF